MTFWELFCLPQMHEKLQALAIDRLNLQTVGLRYLFSFSNDLCVLLVLKRHLISFNGIRQKSGCKGLFKYAREIILKVCSLRPRTESICEHSTSNKKLIFYIMWSSCGDPFLPHKYLHLFLSITFCVLSSCCEKKLSSNFTDYSLTHDNFSR